MLLRKQKKLQLSLHPYVDFTCCCCFVSVVLGLYVCGETSWFFPFSKRLCRARILVVWFRILSKYLHFCLFLSFDYRKNQEYLLRSLLRLVVQAIKVSKALSCYPFIFSILIFLTLEPLTQEKFRIPILGNCCIFSQIWEKVGEILGKIFPKLGKFWNPRKPFIFQKGIFLGKMINYFHNLTLGK